MGFFGRAKNLINGFVSSRRRDPLEERFREQALEEELKKASPEIKKQARENLDKLKGGSDSPDVPSDANSETDSNRSPKKRTL